MQLVSSCRTATMVVCCAMLAACDDSAAPRGPDLTLDMLLANFSDAGALANRLITGGMPLWVKATDSVPAADACPYEASTQRFACPSTASNGLTTTTYFQLFDASGVPQSAFSPTMTAAIRSVAELNGKVEFPTGMPPSTMSVTSHREHTLSGLLSGTHKLNGNRSTTVDFSLNYSTGPVTSLYTMVETTTDLAMPKRGTGNPYPGSGTIMANMEGSEAGLDMSVTLTFNGTSIATRTVRMNGETQTCTLDLSNPDAVPVCHQP